MTDIMDPHWLKAFRGVDDEDPTPYTYSRARVLRRYAAMRRAGSSPGIAMASIEVALARQVAGPLDMSQERPARHAAEVAWDYHHARRYLGTIDLRMQDLPFWRTGRLNIT